MAFSSGRTPRNRDEDRPYEDHGHVKAWDGVWDNDDNEPAVVALLFDPSGGVHVGVNGVAALSLPLPQWDAIKIKLWDTDLNTDVLPVTH